jgi:flagellum-specific ATP synthase
MAAGIRDAELTRRLGTVRALRGLALEADGPPTRVGELCAVVAPGVTIDGDLRARLLQDLDPSSTRQGDSIASATLAEVVAIDQGRVTLMPHGDMQGLATGSTVVALGDLSSVAVGAGLLGRVIDGLGRPLDGGPAPITDASVALKGLRINPMRRPRIAKVLETGIRSIDALLTLGQGQRVGIFSGSGVGKSTLLGMIARHVSADVNVIALIGERGREVREFIEKQLGEQGLARSVVVVASADQPALARIRAAHAALSIAEHFRDQGRQVLLTMDSITRLAMARREVGLSAGEPPTARGYPPSVFAELPVLCERCGTAPSGGSITALLTVLVEGDDFNEPVADALRAILDGHIVLSRHLAHQGQFPAIDVLKSASRLLPDLTTANERETVHEAVRVLSLLDRNRQMVELGAYERGSNLELDAALAAQPALREWLRQTEGGIPRSVSMDRLRAWQQQLRAPALGPAPRATVTPPKQGRGLSVPRSTT